MGEPREEQCLSGQSFQNKGGAPLSTNDAAAASIGHLRSPMEVVYFSVSPESRGETRRKHHEDSGEVNKEACTTVCRNHSRWTPFSAPGVIRDCTTRADTAGCVHYHARTSSSVQLGVAYLGVSLRKSRSRCWRSMRRFLGLEPIDFIYDKIGDMAGLRLGGSKSGQTQGVSALVTAVEPRSYRKRGALQTLVESTVNDEEWPDSKQWA
ncbi:hypothetical protein HPB51_002176 [Rhipicephalus microplus]|uniref:Uncharacterized protein n=1 Tax=Rhipicephalus microplus TaxID=6941 RepID=A0A9J6EK71_RHIMP|nr:hypothetical protein HPB51_002176 [Rhipicephalus microplus]